jgi:CheY-like chemotaxis protein
MAKILVIDDDKSQLMMMTMLLKREGHDILTTADGYEGIQLAHQQRPDLVFIDVMLPHINGFDICGALRKDPATLDIPILMLTSLSDQEDRARAKEAGADGFITKPVKGDILIQQTNEWLQTGARNSHESTGNTGPR